MENPTHQSTDVQTEYPELPAPYRSPYHFCCTVRIFNGGQISPLPRPKVPPPKRSHSPLPLVKLTIPKVPILGPLTESQHEGEKAVDMYSSAQLNSTLIDRQSLFQGRLHYRHVLLCSVFVVSPVISALQVLIGGGFADRALTKKFNCF